MPDINVAITEQESINIQIVEVEPINIVISQVVPDQIASIFEPPEGGKRITKLFFKDGKVNGQYSTD